MSTPSYEPGQIFASLLNKNSKCGHSSLSDFFEQSKKKYKKVEQNIISNPKENEVTKSKKNVIQKKNKDDDNVIEGNNNNDDDKNVIPKKKKKPKHKKKSSLEPNQEDVTSNTPPIVEPTVSLDSSSNNDNTVSSSLALAEEEDVDGGNDEEEKESKTIFVGNVPVLIAIKKLSNFFSSECGPVESVRLRSVGVQGCAVNDHGNSNLVKKVCVNKAKIIAERDSCNAYVVFKNRDSVDKALALSGTLFHGKHLRIDSVKPQHQPKLTVFVGNLPFDVSEEELREHFEKDHEEEGSLVMNVRIVRDRETGLGKGFGYVLLKDLSAVADALKLHESKLKNRKLRVTICGKRTKNNQGKPKVEKKSFEGQRALSGAAFRIKKKNGTLVTPQNNKRKRDLQSTQKSAKKFAKQSGNESTKQFEKPKKPKHAARKAAQAAAKAAGEVYVKVKKNKQNPSTSLGKGNPKNVKSGKERTLKKMKR